MNIVFKLLKNRDMLCKQVRRFKVSNIFFESSEFSIGFLKNANRLLFRTKQLFVVH